jgi:uncharacterized Ntn-hydrolase superfamily protein
MLRFSFLSIAFLPLFAQPPADDVPKTEPANTFSIVARDPDKKEWGVAVASRVLAVGAGVPHAKAGVGAIATQSWANVTFGPRGLALLADGKSATETMKILLDADAERETRQVGIIDAKGETAIFTGKECAAWCGGKAGKNYACQGNLLAGAAVIDDMAAAFEKTPGALAWRLAAALEAAEAAGGDKRGKQSAAILVVRDKAGWARMDDRMIDLRVDDHESPVAELVRILGKRIRK